MQAYEAPQLALWLQHIPRKINAADGIVVTLEDTKFMLCMHVNQHC